MITQSDVAESENGLASRDSICDALPDLDDGKQDGAAKMMRSFSDSWKILLPRPLTLALPDVILPLHIRKVGFTVSSYEQAQPR